MYSYNNIVEKHEPPHKEVIDLALEPFRTQPRPSATQRPVTEGVDCVVVDSFLSAAECDALVAACEKVGFTFWHQARHEDDGGEARCATAVKAVRVVDTIEANLEHLSQYLFDRISSTVHIPAKVFSADMPNASELYQRELEGTWVPHALSPNLLLGRYHAGGHFMPHIDGSTVEDINTRSFYTLLVYLNDCPRGGHTRLFAGEQGSVTYLDSSTNKYRGASTEVVGTVVPRKGDAAFFYCELLHEAAPVEEGVKYICRADLLFRRTPPILTTESDKAAFDLYQAARRVEASGDAMKACKMFQAVRGLSKGVAALYQLD